MNKNKIFEMEHSSNGLQLTPLKELNNKEFKKLISDYSLDINKFYKVEGKLYPYCYIDGSALIEVYEMSNKGFEMFSMKDRISQVVNAHKECIAKKEFTRLFMIIDKPFRFEWFIKLFNEIPDNQKHKIFKSIYSSSEYGFNELDEEFIKEIFKDHTIDKDLFDTDTITIYRGEASKSTSYNKAYSWTTDLEVALWFANRFNSDGKVYMGKVKVDNILDCFQNNESEIVILPKNVFEVEKFK